LTDIRANGLLEPVIFHDGRILDGRNRYRACQQLGIEPASQEFRGPDPLAFVISKNLQRRHLDESQRAMVAARLATLKQGARTDLAEISAMSQPQAAAALNVSRGSVQHATKVIDRGAVELVTAVERGEVSVSAAAEVATQSMEEQRDIVARGEEEILAAAAQIRAARRGRNGERRYQEAAARAVQIIPKSEDGTDDYVAWVIIENALTSFSEAIDDFRTRVRGPLNKQQIQSSKLFGLLREIEDEINGAIRRRGSSE
jgi:ParB-like chromosome segregation protein Spo0J